MKDVAWFLTATLALNLTPGPDMLYVCARSLDGGRAAGVSSLGIAAGCFLQTLAVALGISQLLLGAPLVYHAVRYAGCAYLVFLGIDLLRTKADEVAEVARPVTSLRKLFVQGMTTNLLNPKVGLFFLAFLPQFADPSAGSFFYQVLALGCLFNLLGTTVNVVVAFADSRAGDGLRLRRMGASSVPKLSGAVLIALGNVVVLR